MNVIIDPEFQSLIPSLQDEERRGLEDSLKADGCRDPLVVWDGVLVDGHHRHGICTKHDIEFEVHPMNFADRNDAMRWIIQNQFSRRNLTPYQRMELAMKLKPLIQWRAKGNQQAAGGDRTTKEGKALMTKVPQALGSGTTRNQLAKIAGVGASTLDRGVYCDKHADEETKQKLRRAETTVTREFNRLSSKASGKPPSPVRRATGYTLTDIRKKRLLELATQLRDMGRQHGFLFSPSQFRPIAEELWKIVSNFRNGA